MVSDNQGSTATVVLPMLGVLVAVLSKLLWSGWPAIAASLGCVCVSLAALALVIGRYGTYASLSRKARVSSAVAGAAVGLLAGYLAPPPLNWAAKLGWAAMGFCGFWVLIVGIDLVGHSIRTFSDCDRPTAPTTRGWGADAASVLDRVALVLLPIALAAYIIPGRWGFAAGATISVAVMLGVGARYAVWLVQVLVYAPRRVPLGARLTARSTSGGWAGLGLGMLLIGQSWIEYPARSDIQDPVSWGWFVTGTGVAIAVSFALARGVLCRGQPWAE